jgi:hypothetical protein
MTSGIATRGFSNAAEFVNSRAAEGRKSLQESNALGNTSTVMDELATVWEECQEPNWDGYGALPVTQDALRNTYLFLGAMPLGFPRPSIGAEPDGDLTLEWHRSARRTLSVSVSPYGELHYSALFGPSRVYGTEAFFGDVPDSILNLIRRVYAA